jgi:hypothetical protein
VRSDSIDHDRDLTVKFLGKSEGKGQDIGTDGWHGGCGRKDFALRSKWQLAVAYEILADL